MNDGGIDAETLSSTIEYLLSEPSNYGICPIQDGPIDLALPYQKTGNDLRIDGYDPEIRDSEESCEEDDAVALTRGIKQASGNFSNAFIEKRWNEVCSEEPTKSAACKAQLKKGYDLLRESANAMSLQKISQNQPISVEEPREDTRQDHEVVPALNQRTNQKSKRRRPKFKNVAIESILGIKNTSKAQPAEQDRTGEVAKTIANGVKPAVANGRKPPGRGRFRDSSSRNNISMIRAECISGYNADPDYNPNNLLGNGLPVNDEFPSL